ncbi:uncharacterized protein LOC104439168 [Eucalyptus grandis]|uniref:uncharacterized protein LOC104439168 n=1 Tax=Eucalyptus grandis TaxID=71139 RepID=UPI00192ED55C|nr:uncharacterized protein LOC104439168 [Eucalyptus grandis]
MATSLFPSGTLAVKAAASSSRERNPGPAGRPTASSSSSSNNSSWLAPIFGFSADPGYIDSAGGGKVAYPRKAGLEESGSSLSAAGRPRPDPIRFTAEKARLLRLMTSDAASLHDAMYHSAIASRLASDFGNPTDL